MDTKSEIKEILSQEQYQLPQKEKNKLLLPLLTEEVKKSMEFSPILNKFYSTLGKSPDDYKDLIDIPPIPVSMFFCFASLYLPSFLPYQYLGVSFFNYLCLTTQ